MLRSFSIALLTFEFVLRIIRFSWNLNLQFRVSSLSSDLKWKLVSSYSFFKNDNTSTNIFIAKRLHVASWRSFLDKLMIHIILVMRASHHRCLALIFTAKIKTESSFSWWFFFCVRVRWRNQGWHLRTYTIHLFNQSIIVICIQVSSIKYQNVENQ